MSTLAGRVYRNPLFSRDGFYILNLDVYASEDPEVPEKAATLKGLLPGLIQVGHGVPFKVIGKWVTHRKFGRQFKIASWEPWAEIPEDIVTFLSICVDGFADRRLARQLVDRYDMDTYRMLSEQGISVMAEGLDGVDAEVLQRAVNGWQRVLASRDVTQLLSENFSTGDVQAILAKFGYDAPGIIRDNPYRLLEIMGFKFDKVDKIAIETLGLSYSDPRRVSGAVLWSLQVASLDGHLFLRRGSIPDALQEIGIGEFKYEAVAKAVNELADQKAVVLDPDVGVYLPALHLYERESARILSEMHSATALEVDAESFLSWYEAANNIELSDLQRKAVELLAQQRVLVLTGLPGTGKTMVVRTFVSLFERAGLNYVLMAPTGIAAKRLAAVTGQKAGTIHRMLGYNGTDWGYGPGRTFGTNAVIVDEMSMVDQELFYRLVSALSPETILVLVGDAAQLPSVGPGNVLRELVNSDLPNIRLTQIFRQSEKGAIVQNSHRINRGEMPLLEDPRKAQEFKFVRCGDEKKVAEFIVDLAAKLKAKDANFQVLAPKYDGHVGVNNLNDMLRERLNPLQDQMEWKSGNAHFREGDRLMVVRNDYRLNVHNGDVGKFTRLDRETLEVRIHGAIGDQDLVVQFTEGEAEYMLKLAYAVTVHKSQGNEFDTIVMPILKSQGRMLQRNLLYTAITRARKRVWLIGDESAIFTAVKNDKVVARNTVLSSITSACLAGVES